MQCQCKETLESKVAEAIQKDLPEGFSGFSASIAGYVLTFTNPMQTRLTIPYEGDVQVPKKSGNGFKRQKIKTSIQAKYCPFCGEPAAAKQEPHSNEC
ncbi:hypothetical protein [Vreelandella hamiltonii]|uniref:Uncharacterized protein n=1 Tax=Halomonas johnsoniae TaxID=502832 RepID=A0ABQ2WAE0_9GAMM|nr:hypothetical protein [Halomonas johnsoniae]GGW45251.1 hypothetical protein GCM10007158_02350 [Halomonas johnsoniae]